MISVGPSIAQKFSTGSILRHYKCDSCQTLHDGTTNRALPVHTTFSDLDHISRSQQCQFYQKILCAYLIKLRLCGIVKYQVHIMNVYHFFDSWMYSREIIEIKPHLNKNCLCNVCFFSDTIFVPSNSELDTIRCQIVTRTVARLPRTSKLCVRGRDSFNSLLLPQTELSHASKSPRQVFRLVKMSTKSRVGDNDLLATRRPSLLRTSFNCARK